MLSLNNKRILLGVTGGIAAYKSAELIRLLQQAGADVRVVMTESAKAFITPLTLQALSGYPVRDSLFDPDAEAAMGHIELARWADLVLIAPATAEFIAQLAQGHATHLLATLCLATKATIAVAPAMNQQMWKDTATQSNLKILSQRGIKQLGPGYGQQACGDVGLGRMLEPHEITEFAATLFQTCILAGKKVLITAGPTREAIDPVRFISNYSTGKMGYALAEAAVEAGASVSLISGPTALSIPERVQMTAVNSAEEMFTAVMSIVKEYDIFIATAAVCDYRPTKTSSQKIKKSEEHFQLDLRRTHDILAAVGGLESKPVCIGFAAETENIIVNARDKLTRKNADMIVANQVGVPDQGFASDDNQAILVLPDEEIALPKMSKQQLARKIVGVVGERIVSSLVLE